MNTLLRTKFVFHKFSNLAFIKTNNICRNISSNNSRYNINTILNNNMGLLLYCIPSTLLTAGVIWKHNSIDEEDRGYPILLHPGNSIAKYVLTFIMGMSWPIVIPAAIIMICSAD